MVSVEYIKAWFRSLSVLIHAPDIDIFKRENNKKKKKKKTH